MDTRRYSDRMGPFGRERGEDRFSSEEFYGDRDGRNSSDEREFSRRPGFENELEHEADERYRLHPSFHREKRVRGKIRQNSPSVWKEEGAWESVMNFFGIGPKGYQRSDLSLFEDVCESLTRHSGVDASDIEVEVRDGLVTLKGSVPTRQMKRMAEDCLDDVSGVTDVRNQLNVVSRNNLAGDSAASLQSTPEKMR